MEARAHGATFPMAQKIPMKVAQDFAQADKGQHFKTPHNAARRRLARAITGVPDRTQGPTLP